MELNDTTDYQQCFVCGQRNPYGLHMVFRLEDGMVVADFQPAEEHQGFPGVVHGGIVAAVLDEALNRTTMLTAHPTWTMTGRLEVRYRRYVPFGQTLRVRASLGKERGRLILASGTLTLAADEQTKLAEASGTFMALTPSMLSEIAKEYPQMEHFFDDRN